MTTADHTQRFRNNMFVLVGLIGFAWTGIDHALSGQIDPLLLVLTAIGFTAFFSVHLWIDRVPQVLALGGLFGVSLAYITYWAVAAGAGAAVGLGAGVLLGALFIALPILGAGIFRKISSAQTRDN